MRAPLKFLGYCWTASKKAQAKCDKSRLWLFVDMVRFGYKYESTTIKYMKLEWYRLEVNEKRLHEQSLLKARDAMQSRYKLMAFYAKYGSLKYEHPSLWSKRQIAYTKMFDAGKKLSVRYGVSITTGHGEMGEIRLADEVHLSRDLDLDITGGLYIGNGVHISEGTRILTHGHNFYGKEGKYPIINESERVFKTPLSIEDNVVIGANCLIMPGVTLIGENSIIAAGSIVSKPVPANSLVAGNPAKVMGSIEGLRRYYYYPKPEHVIPEI